MKMALAHCFAKHAVYAIIVMMFVMPSRGSKLSQSSSVGEDAHGNLHINSAEAVTVAIARGTAENFLELADRIKRNKPGGVLQEYHRSIR